VCIGKRKKNNLYLNLIYYIISKSNILPASVNGDNYQEWEARTEAQEGEMRAHARLAVSNDGKQQQDNKRILNLVAASHS
jgi:hypothetical protein